MTTSQPWSFEGKPSSFFAFCLKERDFATKLRIPKAFEEDYTDFLLQQSLQLKTNGSDRRWDVKIKHIDGKFFILDGWSDFVKDYNLVDAMLLVFRIVASSTLHVDVFDHESCLHLPPSPPIPSLPPNNSDEGETSLRFVKELKDYNFEGKGLDIPRDFSEGSGIVTRNLRAMDLEDEIGRKWAVSIRKRKSGYSITSGLAAFLKANNHLKIGTILLFDFVANSNNVMKVSVMEEGAGRELIAQAGRGGFLGERIMRSSSRFVKELTDSNFNSRMMHIPKDFAESTGIATSDHIIIDLEDESGRQWPVSLTNAKNSGLYQICGGWPTFLKANNHLQVGTIVLFEFVPDSDNVVKVTAMEERAGRELLARARRGGLL